MTAPRPDDVSCAEPAKARSLREPGAVLLVSCYELGHQPSGLASPLGFLERAGFAPEALDLAVDELDPAKIAAARVIGVSVPMHTAMRLGLHVLERARALNPQSRVVFYGLYAPLNAALLFRRGADAVIGGEYEEALVTLITWLDAGRDDAIPGVARAADRGAAPPRPILRRLAFVPPSRRALAPLDRYVHIEGEGLSGPAGYVEATRGCLHRCRHCPITPVYDGRFFAVPEEVVLADVRAQVELGATHITFGDPDFLNGPRHALQIARALHAAFPQLSFDCTIKVEHILRHRAIFPELRSLGCVFVVSAFESLNDAILVHLDKGHTRADLHEALAITRAAGLALHPTWVPFTPWTSLDDLFDLLDFLDDEGLAAVTSPVQLAIRLLVPPGSALLALPAMLPHLGALDEEALTFRWTHPDPRVDRLQEAIAAEAAAAEARKEPITTTFATMKRLVERATGRRLRAPTASPSSKRPPRLTEAWFC